MTPRHRRMQVIAMVLFALSITWVVAGWAFARFVHYHSQNRLLSPADYEAEVVSAADYRRLSDSTMRTVELADGRQIVKTESWDSVVLRNYKPLDSGDRFLLVTLKGTAPFLPVLESTLIPVFVLLVIGLALTVAPLVGRQVPGTMRD